MTANDTNTVEEYGWLIENPRSSPSAPEYLSCEGNTKDLLKFCWSSVAAHALRFARKIDAEKVAMISERLQPELWEIRTPLGIARVCEHAWKVVP